MSWKYLLTCFFLLVVGLTGLQFLDQRIISVNQNYKITKIQLELEQFKNKFNYFINNQTLHFALLKDFQPEHLNRKTLSELFYNYVELYPSLKAFYLLENNTLKHSLFNDYTYKIDKLSFEQATTIDSYLNEAFKTDSTIITRPVYFFNDKTSYILFIIPVHYTNDNKAVLALFDLTDIIEANLIDLIQDDEIVLNINTLSNKEIYGTSLVDTPGDVLIEQINTPLGEWKFEILLQTSVQFQYLRKLIWILGFALMTLLIFYMLIIDRKNRAITQNYQNLKETELLLNFHYEREKVLRDIIQKILHSRDINELLQYICNKLGEFLNLDLVAFSEGDQSAVVKFEYRSDTYKHSFLNHEVSEDKQIYDLIINKQNTFVINDITKEKSPLTEELLLFKKGIKSVVMIPVLHNDVLLGVFGFGSTKTNIWNSEKIDYLRSTISQIAIALHQSNLLNELHNTSQAILENIRQEQFLKNLAQAIRTSIEIKEIINIVNNELGKFMNVDRVYIVEYDQDTKNVKAIQKEYRSSEDLAKYGENQLFREQFMQFIFRLPEHCKWNQQVYSKESDFFSKEFKTKLISKEFELQSFISTPIFYQNKLFGNVLIGQVTYQRNWTEAEADFMQKVAEQLAIGMYQIKIYEELKNFTDKQVLINKIFEVIRSSIDLDEILWNACNEIGSFLNTDRCAILLHKENNLTSEPVKYEYLKSKHYTSSFGSIAEIDPDYNYAFNCVIKEKRPFVADEIAADSNAIRFVNDKNYLQKHNITALLIIPIIYADKVLGSIFLCMVDEPRRWTDSDVFFLNSLSHQIAIAIHQASLFTELNVANTKLISAYKKEQTLRKILEVVRSSLDLNKIMQELTKEIGLALKCNRCIIREYDEVNDIFLMPRYEYRMPDDLPDVSNITPSKEEIELGKRVLKKASVPFVVDNVEEFPLTSHETASSRAGNIKSMIITPITIQNKPFGLLLVGQTEYNRRWTTDEIEILKSVADQTALAIAQIKMYEYVRETSRLKSEFLASVSHELKTPLNSIIVLSELMQNQNSIKSPEEQVELLQIIHSSGEELLAHINNILDMAKMEFANNETSLEIIELRSLIDEMMLLFKPITQEKLLTLTLNYDQCIPTKLLSDKKLLKFIINNLMNNAIKFTTEGEVTLNLSCVEADFVKKQTDQLNIKENASYLYISVKDTGIGIDKKYHKIIFDEFRQIEESEVRKYGGTGLGLAITKKSVALLEGCIWVESNLNSGSEFKVILPIYK
jgi:GAF domain-containing protein